MSKHEIRLLRQKFTARGLERFRNYGAVLQRHEKEMRIRKIIRVFSFLFITLIVVMLIIILVNVESRAMVVSSVLWQGFTIYDFRFTI